MTVRWLYRALLDSAEAAAYIAADRPRAAERWREGLIDVSERIAQYPQSSRKVPELVTSELCELIYTDFRVIYLLADLPVIAAVRHCRRRLTKRALREWEREAKESGEAPGIS
jgi:toxin ParE1/3/4